MKSKADFRVGQRVLLAAVLPGFSSTLFAAAPVVSNARAPPWAGTQLVEIYYDVADADSVTLTVTVAFYDSTRLTSVTIDSGASPAHPLSRFLSVVTYSHKPNGPCNENTK